MMKSLLYIILLLVVFYHVKVDWPSERGVALACDGMGCKI